MKAEIEEARGEFLRTIESEDGLKVAVSQSDSFEDRPLCLLQVGREGKFQTAYLNDNQVRRLAFELLEYLVAGDPEKSLAMTEVLAEVEEVLGVGE